MSLRSDMPVAMGRAWLIVSVVLLAAAAAPFAVPSEVLYGLFPACAAKAHGSSCPLCGMTTAFVLISRGDLAGARRANGGSVALWAGSVLNFAVAVAYTFPARFRRR